MKMPLKTLDAQQIALISEGAEEMFQQQNADLLAIYDNRDLVRCIEAEIKLNGFPTYVLDDYSVETLLRCLGETFETLRRRNALAQFQRMQPTPEAQEQIDRLSGVSPAPVSPREEARRSRDAQAALIEEAAADYKSAMPQSVLKKKWLLGSPEHRAAFDAACARGLV